MKNGYVSKLFLITVQFSKFTSLEIIFKFKREIRSPIQKNYKLKKIILLLTLRKVSPNNLNHTCSMRDAKSKFK